MSTRSDDLKADASDEVLREALRTTPGLVQSVQTAAAVAYRTIMQAPFAHHLGVTAFWDRFIMQMSLNRPNPNTAFPADHKAAADAALRQLRLALDARDVLSPMAVDLGHLSGAEVLSLGRVRDCPSEVAETVRAVMVAHPGLAAFQKRRDAEAEQVAAHQKAAAEQQTAGVVQHSAQQRAEAARTVVRRLAQNGITLAVGPKGITARPSSLLMPADLFAIRSLRTELTALLDEPAALVA